VLRTETQVGVVTKEGYTVTAGFRKLVKDKLGEKRKAKLTGEGRPYTGVTKEQVELLKNRDPKLSGLKTFQYKLTHNKFL